MQQQITIDDVIKAAPQVAVPTGWLIDVRNILESRRAYKKLTNEGADALFEVAEAIVQQTVTATVTAMNAAEKQNESAPAEPPSPGADTATLDEKRTNEPAPEA